LVQNIESEAWFVWILRGIAGLHNIALSRNWYLVLLWQLKDWFRMRSSFDESWDDYSILKYLTIISIFIYTQVKYCLNFFRILIFQLISGIIFWFSRLKNKFVCKLGGWTDGEVQEYKISGFVSLTIHCITFFTYYNYWFSSLERQEWYPLVLTVVVGRDLSLFNAAMCHYLIWKTRIQYQYTRHSDLLK
jgi:hypothetical protein